MAQKQNPTSLRLQYNNRYFDNSWYSKNYYDKLITRDIFVQKYINTFLKLLKLPLGRFSVQHLPKKTRLFTFFCYPKKSRAIRSKIFGINLPNVFKFKTKTPLRKNKWNFKKNQNVYYDSKKLKSLVKVLYNQNLWLSLNFSLLDKEKLKNFSFLKKITHDTTLNLFKAKNLYRFEKKNNYNSPVKSNILLDNKITILSSIQGHLKNKNFNSFFSKFLLNLVIYGQLKQEKLKKSSQLLHKKNSQDIIEKSLLKKKNQSYKNIFKFLLIFNNCSKNKNIYLSNISFQYFEKSRTKNINQLQNTLQKRNFEFATQHFKCPMMGNSIIKINKKPQKNSSYYSTFQSEKINVSLYNQDKTKNNMIFNVSNHWKLSNIEKKYKYKNYIQRSLANIYNLNFEFIPFKVKDDWQSAGFLADEIVYFLERRVPFRRIKNKLLKQISQNSNIRGIRITCSGRVGGKSKKAQRAKTECVKLGQTSLHVFSSQIDFAARTAQTVFGSVGIKVWICYN